MRFVNITLFLALIVGSDALPAKIGISTQEAKWKQITIMQSTRDDVEKLLGKSEDKGYYVAYNLAEGHLSIDYSVFNFCKDDRGGEVVGWNVSKWTVINLSFSPNPMPQFSSLNLNLALFRKVQENPCCPDLLTFRNEEEGVAYTVNPNGTLNTIEYFPSSQYDNFHCPAGSDRSGLERFK